MKKYYIKYKFNSQDKIMCIENKICEFCQTPFTYTRVKKPKKYCSQKCGMAYHNKFVRDKDKMKKIVAEYYKDYPAKRFMVSTRSSAKKRNLLFELTEKWFEEKLKRGVCETTGLPIKTKAYQEGARGIRSFYSPSIDRIDNNVGYIPSNCRIVCWGVNLAKNTFTDRDLNALSLSILLRHLQKSCQPELMKLLPDNIISALPTGHPFPIQK